MSRIKVKVSDVANLNSNNFDFKGVDFIHYLDTSSITNNMIDSYQILSVDEKIPSRAKRAVKEDTIVYSSIRPRLCHFGILHNIPANTVVSTGFITLDAKENIDANYLYNCISTLDKVNYISNIADTSVSSYPSINPIDLANMTIEIEENIEKQKKISKLLANIDNKVKTNKKTIQALESFAKTIYDYWFLQFEFFNEEGKPYKSSGGKMVWNEELKREIPEEWEVKNIASLIENDKGGNWGKDISTGNYKLNVDCIRGADFPALLGTKTLDTPERWILEKNKNKKLTFGDILIEISGGSPTQSTGRICYVNNNCIYRFDKPIITSNFCKAISLINPNYYSWFYLMWQTLYDNDLFFNYEGKTTGLKNLLFDIAVKEIKIPIPNPMILDIFTERINPFYEKIQFCCKQNQQLASLRDWLLPMLMNGQVTFKDDRSEI